MTLRCRLSAPELPVKFLMHGCPLGQSHEARLGHVLEGVGASGTSGTALFCSLSQQGRASLSAHFPLAAIAVYSYPTNEVNEQAEVRS